MYIYYYIIVNIFCANPEPPIVQLYWREVMTTVVALEHWPKYASKASTRHYRSEITLRRAMSKNLLSCLQHL